jgi:predicted NUDIX family NTP pyrophosphohydrolase
MFQGNCDPSTMKSNLIVLEWPAGSGRKIEIPEVDRAEWFPLPVAMEKILRGQTALLEQVRRLLGAGDPDSGV